MLSYPTDVDCNEDFPKQHFQLDKRSDLFQAVESAITKLGMGSVSLPILSRPAKDCLLKML